MRAGWSVLTTVTTPDKLGQAIGTGALWLELGGGLSAKWSAQPEPVMFAKPKLQLVPNVITIITETSVDPGDAGSSAVGRAKHRPPFARDIRGAGRHDALLHQFRADGGHAGSRPGRGSSRPAGCRGWRPLRCPDVGRDPWRWWRKQLRNDRVSVSKSMWRWR